MHCSRSPLPPEILDLTIDHFHDEPATLKVCCLVSKSWIPRARRHLFDHVKFDEFRESSFGSWMKTFPDPSNSPAHYTRTLSIFGIKPFTAADTDVGRWIHAFSSVVHLHVEICNSNIWDGGVRIRVSLLPFHGLSPAVRSLHLESASGLSSEVNLMCSFPLLEDFAFIVFDHGNDADEWTTPSTSPRLTGSLTLSGAEEEIGPTARRLLDLPNGLHFTKIVLVWVTDVDPRLANDLVLRCSNTLESLDVTEELQGECRPPLLLISTSPIQLGQAPELDLSTATKLKDLAFRCSQPNVKWITRALRSVESNDLRRITLRPDPCIFADTIDEMAYQEWWDLDRLLVQFRTSRSIYPEVMYGAEFDEKGLRGRALSLLPELTSRGLVDLVEYSIRS